MRELLKKEVASASYVTLDRPSDLDFARNRPESFLTQYMESRRLGANHERQMWTWLILETFSRSSYQGSDIQNYYYYRTPKGRFIHLLHQPTADKIHGLKLIFDEKVKVTDLEILKAFEKKRGDLKGELIGLGPVRMHQDKEKISLFPWESLP